MTSYNKDKMSISKSLNILYVRACVRACVCVCVCVRFCVVLCVLTGRKETNGNEGEYM